MNARKMLLEKHPCVNLRNCPVKLFQTRDLQRGFHSKRFKAWIVKSHKTKEKILFKIVMDLRFSLRKKKNKLLKIKK